MLAACKVHVRRVMVENFHTVVSGPTVCCTVTVKAKLGTFALCGRVKLFVRVRERQTAVTFIHTSVQHCVIHKQWMQHRNKNFTLMMS